MNYQQTGSQQYLKTAVMTASPEQLHMMLIDGAIRFATRGLEALQRSDFADLFNNIERALKIVAELQAGLRRDINPQVVDEMQRLYDFVYRRLIDANSARDPVAVEDALRILRHHRETWRLVIEKVDQERRQAAAPAAPAGLPTADETPEFVGGLNIEG